MGPDLAPDGWQPLSVPRPAGAGFARTSKQEAFLRLALTHALVMGGDAMVTVALAGSIFFSTDVNGARLKVVLSLLLTMAPFAVVAPFLGPAIDRSKGGRRLMVILAAGGRCLVCFYMAGVVHNLLLFLPSALILLILSKAHAIAKSALVPAAVDSPEDLVKAGSRLAVLATVVGLLAGGLGAGVLHLSSARWVLRLAAVVYGAGAVMALRTHAAPPTALDPADHVDEALRSRGVSLAAVCMATIRASSGFLTFAVAFDFRSPGNSVPKWWYGLVIGGALLGAFVGSAIGPSLRRVLGEERILLLSVASVAVVGLVTADLGSRPAVALLAFTVGLADGVGQLAFDAIVQRDGSEGARGRSFARFEASFQLMWVAGALVPVVIGLPTHLILPERVFSLMVALGAGGSAIYYVAGRRAAARALRPGARVIAGRPPPGGVPPAPRSPNPAPSWSPPPGPPPAWSPSPPRLYRDPTVADTDPGPWTAVRPVSRDTAPDVPVTPAPTPAPAPAPPPRPYVPIVPDSPAQGTPEGPGPVATGPEHPARPQARRNPGRSGRRGR